MKVKIILEDDAKPQNIDLDVLQSKTLNVSFLELIGILEAIHADVSATYGQAIEQIPGYQDMQDEDFDKLCRTLPYPKEAPAPIPNNPNDKE